MVEFDARDFIDTFVRAKLKAYLTRSTNPEKQAKLNHLQTKMEEVMQLVDDIVGDEK